MPRLPAASLICTQMLLPPLRVWLASVQLALPTVVLALVQLLPALSETCTDSPSASTAFKLPLKVCTLVWVMKSLLLVPVSLLRRRLALLLVGAAVSKPNTRSALGLLVLPATSWMVALKRLLPLAPSSAWLRAKFT